MKWLNYHHLFYFRVIAKEGSIAKASEKLLVGQPALSTQLKQLEESLGAILFEREHRGLKLTAAGRCALEYADEIFEKGEEFLQNFEAGVFCPKGRYRLGAIAGLPKDIVCNVIKALREQRADRFVSTLEGENEDLAQRLLRHELELVITNDPGKPELNIKRKKIGKKEIYVFGHPRFLDYAKDFPRSLHGAPFILQTMHSKLRYDIDQWFLSLGLEYDLVVECQDSAVKESLARMGEGLVFLPSSNDVAESSGLVEIGKTEKLYEDYWFLASHKSHNPETENLFQRFSF